MYVYDALYPEAGHLRKLGRVAIWNREKIAILIAMLVWVADLALIIYGEYLLTIIEIFLTSPVILQVAYG
jgi:hypothetical protein